jgi:hypothetical protein
MEQMHMGLFFSKLLYSDCISQQQSLNKKSNFLSSEFPSVVAPDLEEKKIHGNKVKKDKKRELKEKRDIVDFNNSLRKERRVITAKNIFTEEEVLHSFIFLKLILYI